MANTHSLDLELSSSQYAYIADGSQTGLDITGDITIEAWVKLETIGITQVIAGKWNVDGNFSYLVYIDSSNRIHILYSGTGLVANYTQIRTTNSILTSTGVWYHVACAVDVSAQTANIYLNSVSQATDKPASGSTSMYNGNSRFSIGENSDTNYFDGLIDEVRVWNDIRTSTEISDNYQTELTGSETGLVGYWKLNNIREKCIEYTKC